MYSSASSVPASLITSPKGGYSPHPSGRHRCFFPVICRVTLLWNFTIVLPTLRVTTHVSDPNRRTACKTALKNVPDVCASAPSQQSILNIRLHVFRYFSRLANTTSQSSYVAIWMRPSYLKDIMLVSGRPYSLKDLSMPALASSLANLLRVCYSPLEHWAVLVWYLFRYTHVTSISHKVNCGWGGVPPSTVNTLSHMWWCENISNEFQIYFETHFLLLETLLDRNKLTDHFLVKINSQSEY